MAYKKAMLSRKVIRFMSRIDKGTIAEKIMEAMWDLAHVWSIRESRFVYFSPAVFRLHGYTQQEALKLHWTDLIAPESLEAHIRYMGARYIRAATQGGKGLEGPSPSECCEYQGLCKDGSRIWLEQNVNFLLGDDGKPALSIGISRDISARRDMENQLKAAYDQMEEMVRHSSSQLKELNTTVNVLLEQRESFKKSYRKDLSSYIASLINPYLEKLKAGRLSPDQIGLIERIEFSL